MTPNQIQSLRLLLPMITLSAVAFILFGVDAAAHEATTAVRKAGLWITLLGVAAGAYLLTPQNGDAPVVFGRQMLVWDGLSFFLSWVALLTVFFVALLSEHDKEFDGMRLSAYFGLLLLSAVGLILIASANDFLVIFISIELISVPSFILTGYLRHQERSSEGAIKFFLIGAFSSAMLAYGLSIVYGIAGTTSLMKIHDAIPAFQANAPLALLAVIFIIVSFGFKIALVPFHMWVPDAFEGAPVPIAAFLSVAPKIAGVAITLRVFTLVLGASTLGILQVLAVLAAITMTVGNIIGLQQTNVVRLLAYSSIAHMGYIFLGLIAGTSAGASSVYFYGWIYLFMNLGAFAVVVCISNAMGSSELSSYRGLGKRAPLLSGLLVLFLLSLAGIPPTAGFVAKFYVFSAAYDAGWVWLVIVAAINSVISVGYYFKILHAMYFQAPATDSPVELDLSARLALWLASGVTLLVGIYPQYMMARTQMLASTPAVQQAAPVSVTTTPQGQP